MGNHKDLINSWQTSYIPDRLQECVILYCYVYNTIINTYYGQCESHQDIKGEDSYITEDWI